MKNHPHKQLKPHRHPFHATLLCNKHFKKIITLTKGMACLHITNTSPSMLISQWLSAFVKFRSPLWLTWRSVTGKRRALWSQSCDIPSLTAITPVRLESGLHIPPFFYNYDNTINPLLPCAKSLEGCCIRSCFCHTKAWQKDLHINAILSTFEHVRGVPFTDEYGNARIKCARKIKKINKN